MLASPGHLGAFIIAVCFAAGLNVYGTVATLGLCARAGLVVLPGDLGVLQSWWVIGGCALLFAIEFVADKIPYVDLVWNVLQTFVRVPVAALLAYSALPTLDPSWQLAAGAVGGVLALAAHSGKTTIRTAVNTSPEPVSNFSLSLSEDVLALSLTWFATQYPILAAGIVIAILVSLALVARWLVRKIGKLTTTFRPRSAAPG